LRASVINEGVRHFPLLQRVLSGNHGQLFAPLGRRLRKRQLGRLAAAAAKLALDGAAVVPWVLSDDAHSLSLLLVSALQFRRLGGSLFSLS
jgi:hypothetical protein